MVGWVFGLVAVIILIVYACLPNKVTGILSIIFCLISGKFTVKQSSLDKPNSDKSKYT